MYDRRPFMPKIVNRLTIKIEVIFKEVPLDNLTQMHLLRKKERARVNSS